VPGRRDFCPALTALISPVKNMCLFTVHKCISIYGPIAQQAGQEVERGRLFFNVSQITYNSRSTIFSYRRMLRREQTNGISENFSSRCLIYTV
jgi:hypothetical protein